MTPRARRDGLIVQELSDETLIYDLGRHRAHCLNRTAALVWRHCDGTTGVEELARLLSQEVQLPAGAEVVRLALEDLARAHLLEGTSPPSGGGPCSRRQLLKRLGALGLGALLPMVQSIVAPAAAQAASPVTRRACRQDPVANAGKCCTNNRRICVNVRGRGRCRGARC